MNRLSLSGWMLILVLAAAALLRFQGMDWGTDRQTGEFHRFHPDEVTMLNNARLVGVDLSRVRTAYGNIPAYVMYTAGHLAGWVAGVEPFDWADNTSTRFTHLVGRSLSAFVGLLTIFVVFLMGRRLRDDWTGVLGAALLAFSPGHIQQCHYFTVDAWLALFVAASLLSIFRLPSNRWEPYLTAGALCGLAAGTRLIAAGLALPFALMHLWPPADAAVSTPSGEPAWKRLARRIPVRSLFGARPLTTFGIVVFLIFVSEPYLFLDPQLFFDETDMLNFLPSVEVTRGEILRIWVLYDLSTTRYLFYITHLLRFALGSPVEIAGLIGIVAVFRSRDPRRWAILLWLLPYFGVVGGFHAKPVRYTTPMLPIFTVLGAGILVQAGRMLASRTAAVPARFRPAAIPAILVLLPTMLFGAARASVFQGEDSRVKAARWVRDNIPEGSKVLTERGGFPTQWMTPPERYDRIVDEATFFITTRGHFLYKDKVDFIIQKLDGVPWIVIIEENRLRQYREAKEVFPVAYEFYTRLQDGDLGYDRVATFKKHPQVLGWRIDESSAEPTITAFDHPRVSVYRRTRPDVDKMLATWQEEVAADERLPDPHILEGVKHYQEGDPVAAEHAFREALVVEPGFRLAHLMLFQAFKRQGVRDSAEVHLEAAKGRGGLRREILIGFVKAGMRREGMAYLHPYAMSLDDADSRNGYVKGFAAQTWFNLGVQSFSNGEHEQAVQDFESAAALAPGFATIHLNLGNLYLKLEDLEKARQNLERTLDLDPNQTEAHLRLAQVERMQGNMSAALVQIRRALTAEPGRQLYLRELMRQGIVHYESGDPVRAAELYRDVLLTLPQSAEAHHNLGLALHSQGRYGEALEEFQRAAELDPNQPATRFSLGQTYRELGRTAEAAAAYRKALELQPDHPGAAEALAEVGGS